MNISIDSAPTITTVIEEGDNINISLENNLDSTINISLDSDQDINTTVDGDILINLQVDESPEIKLEISEVGAQGPAGPQGPPGGTPAGAEGQVQLNQGGYFSATSKLKWDSNINNLLINSFPIDKTFIGLNNVPNIDVTNATNISSGTLDGDRLPSMSITKKGSVPATGTPSGKFLKDDGTWAIASGSGSGTTDHSALSNLSYELSGHTGFASSTFQERTNVEEMFKDAYNTAYCEFTYNSGDLSQVNIWNNSGKGTKLFTKTITYLNNNINTISIVDNITSNSLSKSFSYDIDGNISSITKTYT